MKFLAPLLVVPLYIFLIWSSAFAANKIWNWHLVPLGLPNVTLAQCAAVFLLKALLRNGVTKSKPEDSRTQAEQITDGVACLIAPWLVLLVGWWFT